MKPATFSSSFQVSGSVRVNGQELGANIKRTSAYVQQDDAFWDQLLVREHLWVQAMLRMDPNTSNHRRQQRVNEVLYELGLEQCAEDIIFNLKTRNGISGSERKLLSFASELLTDPPLMLCDEPTSGLDSLMAESVVTALRELAQRGKTVVCTIHQPSSNIFALFDKIQLMAEGRVAFLGSRPEAREFFRNANFPCPVNYNPADHYIHTLAVRPGEEGLCRAKIALICDKFQRSQFHVNTQAVVDFWETKAENQQFMTSESIMKEPAYKSTWWTQLKTLTWRHWLLTIRNPSLFNARIIQIIVYCATMSIIYQHQSLNQAAVRNLNGALFEIIIAISFFALTQLNAFTSELNMYFRDHENALYRADTYFLAKNLIDLPMFTVIMIIGIIPPYWIIGLYPKFTTFLVSFTTFALVYQFSLSLNVYFIAIATGRVDIALNVAPIVRVVLMLLGGFFVNDATIPSWLSWLQYLSWHHYSYEILLIYQWKDVDKIDCSDVTVNGTLSATCFKTGEEVIDYYNFNQSNIWFNFMMLILLSFAFRFFAFLVLLFKSRQQKKTER